MGRYAEHLLNEKCDVLSFGLENHPEIRATSFPNLQVLEVKQIGFEDRFYKKVSIAIYDVCDSP